MAVTHGDLCFMNKFVLMVTLALWPEGNFRNTPAISYIDSPSHQTLLDPSEPL